MPLTSTVWMVHAATELTGRKGTLSLEGSLVVFAPDEGAGEHVVPVDRIRRVRRLLGSPVLELRLAGGEGPSPIAFYFVRPPRLHRDETGVAREDPPRPVGRRARREAVAELLGASADKKEEIRGWVAAIRRAQAGR